MNLQGSLLESRFDLIQCGSWLQEKHIVEGFHHQKARVEIISCWSKLMFFFYCQAIWKIDVCQIGCFSGCVCEQDKKSLKPPPVVKCHHVLTPLEKLKTMSLHTWGVVYFMVFWGNNFRTNLTHWITMCSDTVDGSEIWLTGWYGESTITCKALSIPGGDRLISEPSTVVCHSSRLSDFTCQYLFMLFKNLSAVLPATHFEPLWQELNSPFKNKR